MLSITRIQRINKKAKKREDIVVSVKAHKKIAKAFKKLCGDWNWKKRK